MSIQPIGLLTVLIGLLYIFSGTAFAMFTIVPCMLLGSAGAVLLSGSGTVQPAHLLLGFVLFPVFARRGAVAVGLRALRFPEAGFWLLCVVSFSLVSAIFFPRLFAGMTQINAIGSASSNNSFVLVPLEPTSGNITQSIYLLADFACFVMVLTVASTVAGFEIVLRSLLIYGVVNIVFAAVDLATFATGTSALLEPIRNAQYVIHTDEVGAAGLKRISGSFTEASAFAYATIGIASFCLSLWLQGVRTRWTSSISILSIVLAFLSTSSTAWAVMPVMLIYFYFRSLMGLSKSDGKKIALYYVVFSPLLLIALVLGILLHPGASSTMTDLLNVMLFDKQDSQSGFERGLWNSVAMQNFVDTDGIGGGLGSIRTSSFAIAVLSNIGVVGTVLFLMFFTWLFFFGPSGGDEDVQHVRSAARTACLMLILAACLSGTLVDLGLPFYVFAALACAKPSGERAPRRSSARHEPGPFGSVPGRLHPRLTASSEAGPRGGGASVGARSPRSNRDRSGLPPGAVAATLARRPALRNRSMRSAALAFLLGLSCVARAAEPDTYIFDALALQPYKGSFARLVKGEGVPDWVKAIALQGAGAAGPMRTVDVAGTPYRLDRVCKVGASCAADRIDVLWAPRGTRVWAALVDGGGAPVMLGDPKGPQLKALSEAAGGAPVPAPGAAPDSYIFDVLAVQPYKGNFARLVKKGTPDWVRAIAVQGAGSAGPMRTVDVAGIPYRLDRVCKVGASCATDRVDVLWAPHGARVWAAVVADGRPPVMLGDPKGPQAEALKGAAGSAPPPAPPAEPEPKGATPPLPPPPQP